MQLREIEIVGLQLRVCTQQRAEFFTPRGIGQAIELVGEQLFQLGSSVHYTPPSAAKAARTQSSSVLRMRNSVTETTLTDRPNRAAISWTGSPCT